MSSSPTTTACRRSLPPAPGARQPAPGGLALSGPRLAGSGVAFKVAQLLLADLPGGPATALDLADLATLGTVADVAPIVGENRAIARLGLERLRTNPRPGIAALLARARIAPEAVDLDTIAFALAPRLNAAGRVGEALEAATAAARRDSRDSRSRTPTRSRPRTRRRRDLTVTVVAEARALVAANPDRPASIVRGPWPVGIIGLVAARLAEDRARPGGRRGGARRHDPGDRAEAMARSTLPRRSARAPTCSPATAATPAPPASSSLPSAGPHSSNGSRRSPRRPSRADPRSVLRIDLALPALDVDYRLLRELAGLTPYGPGQSGAAGRRTRPDRHARPVAGDDHTSLTLRRDRDVLDGIAFGRADIAALVQEGDRIDVVARLRAGRSAGSSRSSSRSATQRRAGRIPRPRPSWQRRGRPGRVGRRDPHGPVARRPRRATRTASVRSDRPSRRSRSSSALS